MDTIEFNRDQSVGAAFDFDSRFIKKFFQRRVVLRIYTQTDQKVLPLQSDCSDLIKDCVFFNRMILQDIAQMKTRDACHCKDNIPILLIQLHPLKPLKT